MILQLVGGKPIKQRYTPTANINAGDVVIIGNRPFVASTSDPLSTLQGTPVVTYQVTDLDCSGGIYRGYADAAYPNGVYLYFNITNNEFTCSGTAGGQCVPFGWLVGGPGNQLSDGGSSSGTSFLCSVLHDPTDDTGQIYALGAVANDNITNTNTETAFATTAVIPAGTLVAGDVIHVRAVALVTAQHSTDTNTIKLKISTAANTFTTVINTGAVNAAANAVCIIDTDLIFTAVGNSGAFYATGDDAFGAQGTANRSVFYLANTAINTSLACTIEVTDLQSSASTGDVTQLVELMVNKVRR